MSRKVVAQLPVITRSPSPSRRKSSPLSVSMSRPLTTIASICTGRTRPKVTLMRCSSGTGSPAMRRRTTTTQRRHRAHERAAPSPARVAPRCVPAPPSARRPSQRPRARLGSGRSSGGVELEAGEGATTTSMVVGPMTMAARSSSPLSGRLGMNRGVSAALMTEASVLFPKPRDQSRPCDLLFAGAWIPSATSQKTPNTRQKSR